MSWVEQFADIYVNYIEPGAKILALFIAFAFVFWVWGWIKDVKKQQDFLSVFFNNLLSWTISIVVGVAMFVWGTIMFFLRVANIIIATVRDFFISRI